MGRSRPTNCASRPRSERTHPYACPPTLVLHSSSLLIGGAPCTPPGSLRYARTSMLAPLRSLALSLDTLIGGAPCTPPGSLRYARTSMLAPLRSLALSLVERRNDGSTYAQEYPGPFRRGPVMTTARARAAAHEETSDR